MKKRKLLCGLMSHMTKMAIKSIKSKNFRIVEPSVPIVKKLVVLGTRNLSLLKYFLWIREEWLSVNKIFDFLHDRRAWHKKL